MAIVEVRFGKRYPAQPGVPIQDQIKQIQNNPAIEKNLLTSGIHEHTYQIGPKKFETTTIVVFPDGTALYARASSNRKSSASNQVYPLLTDDSSQMHLPKERSAAVYLVSKGATKLGIQSLYYHVPGVTPSAN